MEEKSSVHMKIKTLLTILDKGYEKEINKLFTSHQLPFHYMTHGHGTASSEIMDYLGLGESKKQVIISLVPAEQVQEIFELLRTKMHFDKPGKGIACTLPISGMSSIIGKILEEESRLENPVSKECEVNPMKKEYLYDLIITIVNQGYSEQVMDAAKEAGATGGTVVHARGLGSKEAAKFLGITIQPEKDMIIILVKREDKKAIMENIAKSSGLATSGKGICFSLPVEDQIGVGFDL